MTNLRVGFKAALAGFALTIAALVPTGASAQLSFQGMTFQVYARNSDTLRLLISIDDPSVGPTGNWSGVTFLSAFELKVDGVTSGQIIGGTNIGALNDWSNIPGGVSGSVLGCKTNGNSSGSGGCFAYNLAGGLSLSNTMSWDINFTGSNLDFLSPNLSPELKVAFGPNLKHSSKPQGSLLSQVVPVPEPEIYAMMGVGLGLLGWIGRRKRLKERSAA